MVPPAQSLPELYYDPNQPVLAGTETEKLEAIIWALQAWKIRALDVVGHASTLGRAAANQRRAAKRADEISRLLINAGFEVTQSHEYPVPHQRNLERQLGYNAFRSVDITLSNNLRAATQASGNVASH
ncbi:MAG: OmpA family protein [Pseudomonadota bacterium]